jgi:hypothetical protein
VCFVILGCGLISSELVGRPPQGSGEQGLAGEALLLPRAQQ